MSYKRPHHPYMKPRLRATVRPRLHAAVGASAPEEVLSIDELVELAKKNAQAGTKWKPPVFDVCPTCKAKRKKEEAEQPPEPPEPSSIRESPEEPEKITEIEEQQSGESSSVPEQEEGEEEEGRDKGKEFEGKTEGETEESEGEEPSGGSKDETDEERDEESEEAEGEGEPSREESEGGAEGEGGGSDDEESEPEEEEEHGGGGAETEPSEEEEGAEGDEEEPPSTPPISPDDIEAAKKGESVDREFREAEREDVPDTITSDLEPVVSAADPQLYRDQKFISAMNSALKDWRVGFVKKTGASGTKLSVKEYIRSKGEEPFTSRIKMSARGRKILVIADFSGSIASVENEYKKAIVSSMETFDSIGTKTALFAFGGEIGDPSHRLNTGEGIITIGLGDGRFLKVKRFEEPKWRNVHSARASALMNEGGTPTATMYEKLKNYIRMHRPDVTVTLTDGVADDPDRTAQLVKELKTSTRMVAFGIGRDQRAAEHITQALQRFGYHSTLAVASLAELPKKMVRLVAPT